MLVPASFNLSFTMWIFFDVNKISLTNFAFIFVQIQFLLNKRFNI